MKNSAIEELLDLGILLLKVFLSLAIVLVIVGALFWVLSFFSSTGKVISNELSAEAIQRKYEWFINQSNGIEKMDKDIALFEQRRADVEKRYVAFGEPSKWSEGTKAQYLHDAKIAKDDLVAVVSQRNNLVAEYNANSEKWNWGLFKDYPEIPNRSYFAYVVK